MKATYYVAPPDAKWSAAERNAYLPGKAYLLFVSVHEVWPGHYLQSQFANANPSRVAALWWNYSFAEGWAHYAEEMMYDAGLGAGEPEMRIGMLTQCAAARRAVPVRHLSAQRLHDARRVGKDVPRDRHSPMPAMRASRRCAAPTIRDISPTPSASS